MKLGKSGQLILYVTDVFLTLFHATYIKLMLINKDDLSVKVWTIY